MQIYIIELHDIYELVSYVGDHMFTTILGRLPYKIIFNFFRCWLDMSIINASI